MKHLIIFYLFLNFIEVNGQILDTVREFHSNGLKASEYTTFNGEYQGQMKGWYDNGQLSSFGHYDQGKPIGKNITWYPNGQIKSLIIFSNGEVIKQEMWFVTGRKMSYYKLTKRKSRTIYWYDNGKKLLVEKYTNGYPIVASENIAIGDTLQRKQPDTIVAYFKNKKVFITRKDGIIFDSAGNIITNNYKGTSKLWYLNGQLQSRCYYKNGQINGILYEWNESGLVTKKENYKNGKLVQKEI